MDRRSFLKALGAALSAPALSPVLAALPKSSPEVAWLEEINRDARARWAKFDPAAEYGASVLLTSAAAIDVGKELVIKSARWVLPPGTKFYVLEHPMEYYGPDEIAVAWYYTKKPLSEERRKSMIAEVVA